MLISILLRQIAIMALLAAVGVYLSRKGFLSPQGTKDLGAILLRVIIPCVIVKSYITEFSRERLLELALSAGLALIGFILAMVISYLVFGKRRRLENFAASFCNAGFIGIPLAQAIIGEEGVFYIAASVALLNLFQWTYGVYIMADRKDAISAKTIAKNPVVIAIVIGVVLFVSQIPVPGIVTSTLGYIAGMNTPIAMILMGTYLAKLPLKKLLDKRAYGCVLFRLVIIPAVILSGCRHSRGRQHLRVRPAVRLRLRVQRGDGLSEHAALRHHRAAAGVLCPDDPLICFPRCWSSHAAGPLSHGAAGTPLPSSTSLRKEVCYAAV